MGRKKVTKTMKGAFDDIPEEKYIPSSEDTFFENESNGEYDTPLSEGKKMHRIQTLTMPGDEPVMESILNRDTVRVTNRVISPCPKEGIILVLLEYDEFV